MTRLALLLACVALFSCNAGKNARGHALLAELRTGGCFGFCPIIRLTVHNNGFTEYEGIRFAEKIGLDSFQLTKSEVKALRKKVKQVDLWQYPDKIESQVADAPFVTLTAFRGTEKKSVVGSIDRPEPLLDLEKEIKGLAQAHGFEVTRGVNPNEPPAHRRQEVIVKLKPDVNAGNWIRQFSEFRFLLVRRISQENIWLVAYDPEQIIERAVLALFKNSADVLTVQPNRTAEDRE